MSKKKQARFYKRKDKKKNSKLKDWVIFFLTLVLVVYALSLVRQLTLTKAQGTEEPIYIKIQVLNGCGESGLAERIRDQLISGKWGNLVFDVVDVDNFKDSAIPHSLVLDRKKEGKIAYRVADALEIEKSNVLLKRLEDNYLDIDVTLVLGADYSQIFKK